MQQTSCEKKRKSHADRKRDLDVEISESERRIRSNKLTMTMYADDEEEKIRAIRSGAYRSSSWNVQNRLGTKYNKDGLRHQNGKLACKNAGGSASDEYKDLESKNKRQTKKNHNNQSPLPRGDDKPVGRKRYSRFSRWEDLCDTDDFSEDDEEH
ncbi:uncharacterized protein LOC118187857 [Stegodyphus dumicola]|uniref:uncharacterized protein LOC118187857 n=1 Tax=Stegodyphus dumicola TaxID=202533 RepID=UPI0015AABFEE|nr:uncharacterized protein LOC118187857 [Stegodyphus dumicola]XP_035214043.1 uncharacterized protein LOC118187857 [Stegodyphus dumicola]XP_035214051.1 uncharacterized protein LOC118187857 [Stegodyphus dumicola]XP_035214058.1 uncharacterized protein LOC118187857 [Stegodyphus dumicola]XP_035214065.1 uncharacterized protein LOC118187857 [Stegodyphus dumicola]XP_035214073.1 uncharacterized protein LOC118187857 [Stegodyphus dumicola]